MQSLQLKKHKINAIVEIFPGAMKKQKMGIYIRLTGGSDQEGFLEI